MNRGIKKYIIIIFSITIISSCNNTIKEKTGFIELTKIVETFKLKKELESNLVKLKSGRSGIMDSLKLELEILSRQIKRENNKNPKSLAEFDVKKEVFLNKRKEFESEFDSLASMYDQLIITKINQYVKNYGIENHYTYIFGAEGSGVLMYSDSTKNITTEVNQYINHKY